MLPHGFGCAPAERRGAATVVGEQPLFALLCRRADRYRHWSTSPAKPRLNARRVHVRPPHTADADMTQQAAGRQEMPKLKAQLESQARSACVVLNGLTLYATGNMRDPTHVEGAITSRIRPEPDLRVRRRGSW